MAGPRVQMWGSGGSDDAEIGSRWTIAAEEAYRARVSQHAMRYTKVDKEWDCADFAITVLVDFARRHDLPVRFNRTDGWEELFYADVEMPQAEMYCGKWVCRKRVPARPYESFEDDAHDSIGAAHLLNTALANTKSVDAIHQLRPGDLIVLSQGALHVQLVYANGTTIESTDDTGTKMERRVLEILQGNTPPARIVRKAWDIEAINGKRFYHKYDPQRNQWHVDDNPLDLVDMWKIGEADGRRWNFRRFNESPQ